MTELPLYKVLRDQTRQDIINMLGEKGSVSYTGILTFLNVSTGKLNYHLKILAPFIRKEQGSYMLNETGDNAYKILKKFTEEGKVSGSSRYRSRAFLFLPVSIALMSISYLFFWRDMYYLTSGISPQYIPSLTLALAVTGLAIAVIGLITMLLAVYYLYTSGSTKISTPEMVAISVMAAFLGSLGALFTADVYGNGAFALSFGYFSPLTFMGTIVLFSTFVGWSLDSFRRWVTAGLMMISASMVFLVIIFSSLASGFSGELVVILPLPVIFLAATAVSRIAIRLSYNTSRGGADA